MSNFSPIRNLNAIDQAIFVIKLSRKLETNNLHKLEENKETLPSFISCEKITAMGVELTSDGPKSVQQRISGLEFRSDVVDQGHILNKLRSSWILRVNDDTIQLNNLNYEGWEKTIPFVREIYERVIKLLALSDVSILEVVYQVNDVFIAEENLEQLNIEDLFAHNKYLTENIWERKTVWHVNSGWYDSDNNGNSVLNILNISTRTERDEKERHITIIEHLQKDIIAPTTIVPLEDSCDFVFGLFEQLHEKNKIMAKELLSKNTQEKIGL